MKKYKEIIIRFILFFIGLAILSFGIVLTIKADFGVAPWDVLHIGLYKQFGLTIGMWSIIVGIIVLSTSSVLLKEWPKLGSFLNMVLVGVFIDLFLLVPWLTTPEHIVGKLMMLIIGIIVVAFGLGIYISAKLGAGPRDSLMLAVHIKTGWKIQHVRSSMEIIVLVFGWFLGGPVHIGTVITSLTIGHIVGITLPLCQKMADHLTSSGQNDKWVQENEMVS